MKHSSGPRKTATLSESIHQRLNSYALAAGAAGVSLLSLAQPSEAKIVYTPAHLVFGIIGNYGLDLNHDGITDFTLQNRTYCTWSFCGATLLVSRSGNNRVEGLTRFAYALTAGSPIGPKRPFNGLIMASFLPGGVGFTAIGTTSQTVTLD